MGGLFVISGPSGVGKGTVVRRLRALRPELAFSVSCTTRPTRPNETDGVDYLFVSDGEFSRLIQTGAFLEWAQVFGHRYGTPWGPIQEGLNAGKRVILEIDVQGAASVRQRVPGAVLIFLAPPTLDELSRRLRARHTENEADLELRLAGARQEMEQAGWFDHVVVNELVDQAAADVAAIIDSVPGDP